MKNKGLVITGSIVLVGGLAYLFVNKAKKRKEIDLIMDKITGESATVAQANAFSPLYWRGINKSGEFKASSQMAAQSKVDAKIIWDSLGRYTWDNDDKVIGVFKTFPSKFYVSMVSDSFQTAYKTDMRKHLEHLDGSNLAQVIAMVTKLNNF